MGDANAKVGSDNISYEEVMGKQGLGVMNDNGERFADFCCLNDLVIGGAIFPHKDIHKATWVSPDGGTENQIDHICISRKFRRSLQDVRVFRGADIGSDHHLVIATFQLKLKRYSRNPTTKRLIFQDYKHKDWISQESLNRLSERREKKAAVNNSRTRNEKESAQREYSDAAKEVKRSIKNDKEAFTNELAERAEKAAQGGHTRTLYETTKVLAGKRKNTEMPVKDAEGNTIFSQELQMTRWVEHFESLLNRPPPIEPPEILPARNDLDINCEPPTLEEIENAAFDSIDRNTLWKLLRHYGIPPKILTLIQKMYDGTSCKVLLEGRLTDSFEIKTGVRQGCLLSPFLFILAVDWLMKESTSGSRNGIQWTLWTQLDDLDFADDIALVSHNHSQMQDMTSTVNQLSGSIGLRIHPGQSKMLKIKTEDTQAITVGGKPLEFVENFTYLGSVIDHSGGTAADVSLEWQRREHIQNSG
ncbi:hypothetical protein RRG08_028783 [Elysia crispata]|uniref:Reverse transcriptase domain-containing protein n=1 Tax=Elysia crispata TaxID=231223 RepID=A0AAE0XT17_9GAST|nr:hypothetical protein RRG08_028783 [Elysia crispata]